ncbi:MAG TPA: hypothetical protein VMH83_01565 [Candidatus Acidoferrum sp.]|nr:hypothetical protein [Candidatus Acidoferrum sp.]
MTAATLTLALPPLRRALAAALQELALALQRKLGGRTAPTMAELVCLNLRLRQLYQWLPLADAERGPLDKLQRLLPALLQPQAAAAQARLLAFVLQRVQALPSSRWVALRSRATVSRAAQPLLVTLWQWQQQAQDQDTTEPTAFLLVEPYLNRLLLELAALARAPTAPADVVTVLSRLYALAAIAGLQPIAFAALLQRLSLALTIPALVTDDERRALWQALWRWPQGQPQPAPPLRECHDLELLQAVQHDLAGYRWQLQQFAQQTLAVHEAPLPFAILLVFYRLPWIVAAAGNTALADYCHLWHHCLLGFWRSRLPLPPPALALLCQLPQLLELAQWPQWRADRLVLPHLQLLALAPSAANAAAAELPELLSRAFGTLSQAQSAWFADADTLQTRSDTLMAELRQLERAAAALRLAAIENYASLLLALTAQALRSAGLHAWPAELLWQAYRHLLDLLDEAAAWQQPLPDQALVQALQLWLQQARHEAGAVREVAPDAAQLPLGQRLQRFVEALAQTLDQPVHFNAAMPALPSVQAAVCEAALQPVLREEVLAQLQARTQRRAAGQPRAITLQLQLVAMANGAVAIELNVDGIELPIEAATLKRLRYGLPSAVQRLEAGAVPGRGRQWRLIVAD